MRLLMIALKVSSDNGLNLFLDYRIARDMGKIFADSCVVICIKSIQPWKIFVEIQHYENHTAIELNLQVNLLSDRNHAQ